MIEVTSAVRIEEIDGNACVFNTQKMVVKSHWNRRELVTLVVDGKEYAVNSSDLVAAAENATRTNRF